MIRILQLSGVVAVSGGKWDTLVRAIQSTTDPADIARLMSTVEWDPTKKNDPEHATIFVFLGDLVDTRRWEPGVIPPGSEEALVETLERLQGGSGTGHVHRIHWVLGNHDVANAGAWPELGFCRTYAHAQYCDDTGMGTYHADRIAWMRRAILSLGAVAVLVLHGIAFCHGGLCSEFLQHYQGASSAEDLVMRVNDDFRELVSGSGGKRLWHLSYRGGGLGLLPTWCRRGCRQEGCDKDKDGQFLGPDMDAMARVGAGAMCVAHTIMEDGITLCREEGCLPLQPKSAGADMIAQGSMYFTDIAMSRAFGPQGTSRIYACLEIQNGCVVVRQRHFPLFLPTVEEGGGAEYGHAGASHERRGRAATKVGSKAARKAARKATTKAATSAANGSRERYPYSDHPGYKNFCNRRHENICENGESIGICKWSSETCNIKDGQRYMAGAAARKYHFAIPTAPTIKIT